MSKKEKERKREAQYELHCLLSDQRNKANKTSVSINCVIEMSLKEFNGSLMRDIILRAAAYSFGIY